MNIRLVLPVMLLLTVTVVADEIKLKMRVAAYTKIMQELSLLSEKIYTQKNIIDSEADQMLAEAINPLQTLIQLKEFAILSYHIGHFESGPPEYASNIFLSAHSICLKKIAEYKSKEATEALLEIEARIQLDGGDSLDFKRLKKRQIENARN